MGIHKIVRKTTCLYRKWVWLGVKLGHRDLISVFHNSCLFLLSFPAYWCASHCIITINSVSLYNHIKVLKKAHKCSVYPLKIPSWVLVNIFTSRLTAWSGKSKSALHVTAKNMSLNTCISEMGSSETKYAGRGGGGNFSFREGPARAVWH